MKQNLITSPLETEFCLPNIFDNKSIGNKSNINWVHLKLVGLNITLSESNLSAPSASQGKRPGTASQKSPTIQIAGLCRFSEA